MARRNIDAWLPAVEAGAEALVATASGCGAHLRDYPHLLAADPDYADKATRLTERVRDPLQLFTDELLDRLPVRPRAARIAVHTPCTLQHALHLNGQIERVLLRLGYEICLVNESHLCCGSAGTYSILQRGLSQKLRERKLRALATDHPDLVVTANIGCLMHLDEPDGVRVIHWLNLLADDLEH